MKNRNEIYDLSTESRYIRVCEERDSIFFFSKLLYPASNKVSTKKQVINNMKLQKKSLLPTDKKNPQIGTISPEIDNRPKHS